ncbi:MAG: Uroporphyrinogen-III synthase [uncultured bacterium]|nr:MAG: Uroporphyrinogen-III synthase [uncultured bacterium]OFW68581.1 MAG: hypothetical protein A2X70_02450 [Alphaproteobacteria bacterium GWC2_42_16]OFW73648.1 MAG: hypothetical protein A2Z80_02145 [Alphaproteobacteria bacterium GWA2_41_27]OFW81620.1 MAG: hypothetical protein A3E50_06520 [Alphaproteobacteria bacterium RIFCSPHIGHO2_12_FULL_42_100]OFW85368.1 MAG: hypothetical protein A2W06_03995 [Alphaproteobacteria bacterium RBG_16_42_14]OFW90502.1 MAG: hypothetical protein A3C41_06325 [Alpha
MFKVLLIRPFEDAEPLMTQLEALGKKALCYPLFNPFFLPAPPLTNPQALIITSKNALRAIQDSPHLKSLPLYVVGDQTEELARELGFTQVISGGGTSQDLLKLVLNHAHATKGALYHLSGQVIKSDLTKELNNLGFKAERKVVYGIKDIAHFPKRLIIDFLKRRISHVLFFSARTTELFVTLFKESALAPEEYLNEALCLSYDIAEKAKKLPWKKVWISPHPSTKNIIGYFNDKKQ